MKKKVMCMVVVMCAISMVANAASIAYAGFDYTLGDPAVGQNGGTGWADAWQTFEIDPDGAAVVGSGLGGSATGLNLV